MRYTIAVAALFLMGAHSGPISKFDSRRVTYEASTHMKLEDVERCLIDLDRLGPTLVYRQPDRPDTVTLIWNNRGLTLARVDLFRDGAGTKLRSWLDAEDVHPCIGLPR